MGDIGYAYLYESSSLFIPQFKTHVISSESGPSQTYPSSQVLDLFRISSGQEHSVHDDHSLHMGMSARKTNNHAVPSIPKTFVQHLYNAGPASKTLCRRCTNVMQLFHVCWAVISYFAFFIIPFILLCNNVFIYNIVQVSI